MNKGGNPLFLAIVPLMAAAACKPAPDQRQFMPTGDPERGKQVIEKVGCASCHTIPGIAWPQGKAAMPLKDFSRRALIAGHVPNKPELLARFVRNAPAVLPGTTMPPMPITEAESHDIAAYLYEMSGS